MDKPGIVPSLFPEKPPRALLTGAFAFLAITLIRNSWMSDDAYITLRTIVNLLEGYGPVFNPGERVQAYSHPLWFGLMIPFYALTREAFFTIQILSLGISLLTVWIVQRKVLDESWAALAFLLVLPFSKAYVDFSSSGLENCLSFLLIALFAAEWFRPLEARRISVLGWIACLAILNRHDNLLFFLPALSLAFWQARSWRNLLRLALSFTPFVAWSLFSLFYYGFPFPNTAYAKLNTGIPSTETWVQGFSYLMNSLFHDPISLSLAGIAVLASLSNFSTKKESLPLTAGIFLYLIYVAKIGGDFMSGRFISSAFFLAAVVLSRASGKGSFLPVFLPLILLGIFNFASPVYPHTPKKDVWDNVDRRGIADERAFYETERSLLYYSRDAEPKIIESSLRSVLQHPPQEKMAFIYKTAIGVSGYYSGPTAFIVDNAALSEPLLARLPMDYSPTWRIGHFIRVFPEGYRETLESGENKIRDPKLKEYYNHLCVLTRAPLFAQGRLSEIFKFNTGKYEHLIDRERYRNGGSPWSEYQDLQKIKPEGTAWNDPGNRMIRPGDFVKIQFPEIQHQDSFEISIDNNDTYRVEFFLNGKKNHEQWISPEGEAAGLITRRFALPATIRESGFDRMYIIPVVGDNVYVVGHLRFPGHE